MDLDHVAFRLVVHLVVDLVREPEQFPDLRQIIFDRSRSGIPFSGQEKDVDRRVCVLDPADRSDCIELQLFLDINSLEVFINGGRYVMTGNVYPDPEDTGVQFFAEGGSCTFRNIVKFDIVV